MSELSDALATPIEIELGGKTYKAGIITMNDWAAFEAHAHNLHVDRIVETAKKVYGDNPLPDSVLDRATKSLTEQELDEYQSSVQGISFLLWRSLIKYNPNMTEQEVSGMVVISDIGRISQKFLGLPESGSEKKTKPVKAKTA